MKYLLSILALSAISFVGNAQVETTLPIDTAKQHNNKTNLSIGSGGIKVSKTKDTVKHFIDVQFGMLDIGVNTLRDETDYSSAESRRFLGVDAAYANKDLFALRNSKSINVNIYPVLLKANLVRTKYQKLTLTTGLGLQLYNFRFNKPVSYRNDPQPYVALDTISFSKNKLSFNYLTVPLMLTSKTRIGGREARTGENGWTYRKGVWLVYGVGVSGGYLLSSWTKQISDERGKDKNHDPFNFRNTNLCVNGEIGLDGYFRLFASYQLTPLHENGLVQRPVSIGLRFLGI